VPPGKYQVLFNGAPRCHFKSVQSGGRTLNTESLEVAECANLDLLMTFSNNAASVTGDVEALQDQPGHSVRVLLISEERAPQWKINPAELDQSLHFSIDCFRPGKYIVFATQEQDFDIWNNTDFVNLLRSEGTEMELHENQHATLHLKIIPKDVTDRIRQQLGI